MFKRISILTLIVLSALGLAALTPMNTSASVTAQDTVVVSTIVTTIIAPTGAATTVVVPVTGTDGTPFSTLLIIGLLIILGLAIIVGGMAMNQTPRDDVPPDHRQ